MWEGGWGGGGGGWQSVFVSSKIQPELKVEEKKPPIVNQQCVVYKFQCDLCDTSYVEYTLRHLHQHAVERKNRSSSIGKHYTDKHRIVPKDLDKQFFGLVEFLALFSRINFFT